MDQYLNLENAVILAGLIHITILSAGYAMTRVLNWKTELQKLDPLTQHVIWTHGAYIWFVILGFGIISLCWPSEMITQAPFGPAIALFIALFWGVRLIIQLFFFDARPYTHTLLLKLGYHGLTFVFAYFTAVYSMAFYTGLTGAN